MELIGRDILSKLKNKNRGNSKLLQAIDQLIVDLESLKVDSTNNLKTLRSDFEKVHNDGFYFVNIHIHRVLLVIKVERNEVKIVWAGNHDEYVRTFKNNKKSIEKWIRINDLTK
ncbi:type II toxin-antitoxin system HigB family toxin [Dyadobacter sp. CY326]|nr:type II toxin-antitoxin system HigB family toxin [Dyadobacter sp. CY326]